jgi:MoxR-like ATPase
LVSIAADSLRVELDQFRADFHTLRDEIGKVMVGQEQTVVNTLVALVAGGHVLLEGVPGLGKTLLVRTLAAALRSRFSRIQFTPDLMPADLIGTNVMLENQQGQRYFEFQPGPIFTNVLLADEVNRATPKTQSALLEAMQEHAVTVAGITHPLPGLFFVMATQNPLEMEGTYPLPEAQLDRFFCKLLVEFPTTEQIERILDRTTETETPTVEPCLDAERILAMSQLARQIPVADEIRRYGISLVMATHPEQPQATPMTRKYVRYGASPRGAQALVLAAKIRAILDHRYHVAREDIQAVALHVLRHRLILNFEGQADGITADDVLRDVLQHTPEVPVVGT